MTTDWFFPGNQSIAIRVFKSTLYYTILIAATIYTDLFMIFKSGCYPTKFLVVLIFLFFFNRSHGSFSEVGLYFLVNIYNDVQFLGFEGSCGIAFFATTALAFAEIANKLFFDHFIAYQYVFYN